MGRQSAGCRTCVRRRIKCDESRPFCNKCTKSRVKCDGFRDSVVFFDETENIRQGLSSQRCIQQKKSHTRNQKLSRFDNDAIPSLSNEIDLSAFSQDICNAFLLERFVATGVRSDYIGNKTWMSRCLSKPLDYPLASQALRTLSASYFGRRHFQDSIIAHSAKSYGQTLSELSKAIQDEQRLRDFDCLATIAALYYYEFLTFTTHTGWLQHTQALAKIIELRGPKSFQLYPERTILEMYREVLIGAAYANRRRTFLEHEEWHLDYTGVSSSKQHIAKLMNLYAVLPGITEDVQGLQMTSKSNSAYQSRWNESKDKVAKLIIDLDQWYTVWASDLGHRPTLMSCKKSKMDFVENENVPLDTVFDFEDLRCATAYTMYCMIKISALRWEHRLKDPTWEGGDDHEGMVAIPKIKNLALSICRSVGFFLQPLYVDAAPFYLSVPVRVAYLALPKHSDEAQWLSKIVRALADRQGVEFPRNILQNMPIRRNVQIGK